MQLATFQYLSGEWSCDSFPALDSENTWVLVFADNQLPELNERTQELLAAYPNSKVMGCSTSGEIFGTEVSDLSISVAVAQLEKSQLTLMTQPIQSAEDSKHIATQLIERLTENAQPAPLKGVFALADGMNTNGTQFVETFEERMPHVPLMGGLAGDGGRFGSTQLLVDGQWQSNQVSVVAFYGENIQLGHASKGGWDKFGPERLVSNSQNNVVYELDGKPALELYKTYLGDLAKDLPASALFFPMGIVTEGSDAVVRAVLNVDEANHSLTFAGDVPQGSFVQLMRANFDRVIDGASDAAEAIGWSDLSAEQPTLLVSISCVGRRVVLKDNVEEEVEATLEMMPENTQQVGFYSYGEISPLANGVCGFHNQTMTLTTLRED